VTGPPGGAPDARRETPLERLDRHWNELLQEVRVVQTGVQLLTGFLLTLPFQQRFTTLGEPERVVYLVAVALSATSTATLIAPVALHRSLFRRGARPQLIAGAQRLALAGLAMLGLAVTAVVGLIFDVVVSRAAGLIAGILTLLLFAVLWFVIPMMVRDRAGAAAARGTAQGEPRGEPRGEPLGERSGQPPAT
jgi:hypothetical protein